MLKKLNDEIVKALKEKNNFRQDALKMIKSEILTGQKAVKLVSESETVKGYYKKLKKVLDIPGLVEKQPDYINKIKDELKIIEEFLPKTLSKEELIPYIVKHMHLKQVGAIIKAVKEDVNSAGYLFDGKLTTEIILDFQKTVEG